MFRTFGSSCGVVLTLASLGWSAQTVYPLRDGTLWDGPPYGVRDGIADAADWTFSDPPSGYEGSITLTTSPPQTSIEHRLVWEYDLGGVTVGPWVQATLRFTIRGADIWPLPDVNVHVYSFPANLVESLSDFAAGPAVLMGSVRIAPFQDPTAYQLDVSEVVSEALLSGTEAVAFRFQIDPDTPHSQNQAFIDAKDGSQNLATKPFLTITQGSRPGDYDRDGDADLADYLVHSDCLSGPETAADPSLPGVTPGSCVQTFDFDGDTDVDLRDFARFQHYISAAQP